MFHFLTFITILVLELYQTACIAAHYFPPVVDQLTQLFDWTYLIQVMSNRTCRKSWNKDRLVDLEDQDSTPFLLPILIPSFSFFLVFLISFLVL